MTLAPGANMQFFAGWLRDVREAGSKAPRRDISIEARDAALAIVLRLTLVDTLIFAQDGLQIAVQAEGIVIDELNAGSEPALPSPYRIGVGTTSAADDAQRVLGGNLTTSLLEQRFVKPDGSETIHYVPGATRASRAKLGQVEPSLGVRRWIEDSLQQDPREVYKPVTVRFVDQQTGDVIPFKTFTRALLSRITLINPLALNQGFVTGLVDLELQPETVTVP
jgi:uncharacterized protein YdeI (BOF family)